MNDHDHQIRRRGTFVLIGFLLVAGFFLITEHTAHFFGLLPYLIRKREFRRTLRAWRADFADQDAVSAGSAFWAAKLNGNRSSISASGLR
jgi:hypothetical protein